MGAIIEMHTNKHLSHLGIRFFSIVYTQKMELCTQF